MAVRNACDVFETVVKGVEEYRVTICWIRRTERATAMVAGTKVIVVDGGAEDGGRDLCPKAHERLIKGIKKLLVPPSKKEPKDDENPTATTEEGNVRAADGEKVGGKPTAPKHP